MLGYSYGGYTTGEAMLYDRRIDAGINLDGTMAHGFGVSADWPYTPGRGRRARTRPPLPAVREHGGRPSRHRRSELAAVWANQRGWKLHLTRRASAHGSFSDIQVVWPQITPRLLPATFEPVIGTIDPDRSIGAQRACIASFFGLHLSGRDNHLLDGRSASFPEVEFVQPAQDVVG